MKNTKQDLKIAARLALTRAQGAGRKASERLFRAADTALIYAGDAARQRQHRRTAKAALKVAGKAAIIAGTAAAAVMAARAVRSRKVIA